MSLADKIKARPENNGKGPSSQPKQKQEQIEVSKEEIKDLNDQLDQEVVEDESNDETEVDEVTPEEAQARTKDSYEDEIKKLREENAKRRKKEQAAREKALATAEEIYSEERKQHETQLAEMKKELEELKSLKKEEAAADDNVKKAEVNAEMELLKQQMDELKKERDEAKAREEERLKQESEEKALRQKAAENRFHAMLNEIPEEHKEYATLMFKGSSDPSEGLLIVSKAKAQGLFGKKKVEIVNQMPNDDNNNNKNKPLTKREKQTQRVNALKNKREGLSPGQRIL